MTLSTRDFAQLTDELQSIYEEHSANAIAGATGLQVFDVAETELKTFEHQILHGVAGIENLPEGAALPRVNGNEGKAIIALNKSLLIIGELLTVRLRTIRGKLRQIKNGVLQPQRLSEESTHEEALSVQAIV